MQCCLVTKEGRYIVFQLTDELRLQACCLVIQNPEDSDVLRFRSKCWRIERDPKSNKKFPSQGIMASQHLGSQKRRIVSLKLTRTKTKQMLRMAVTLVIPVVAPGRQRQRGCSELKVIWFSEARAGRSPLS